MGNSSLKLWRDSAAIIILTKLKTVSVTGENYKVLCFKRSEKTSFSSSIVFPGGAFDPQDQSKAWLEHFKKFNITDSQLQEVTTVHGKRPPIFYKDDDCPVKREISLRITAVREAFEEVGVLLCKGASGADNPKHFGQYVNNFNKKHWQEIVHDDPSMFLTLCQKLEVYPDLWSLYEWSTWLTPTAFKARRFETAFFIVALDTMPEILPEKHEVEEAFWKTPSELLRLNKNFEIWLPPPQFYELNRLSHQKDITKLIEFAAGRNASGTTLFLPVVYMCEDGMIHVMPGDDLYPIDIDFNDCVHDRNLFMTKNVEAVRNYGKKQHRAVYKSLHDGKIYLNFEQFDNHLSPIDNDKKSKL